MMDSLWKTIGEKCRAFSEHWAAYSVVGTFALYLLGYLVTRFQLTMLGVGTTLDVLEERYLFAGAKFAVYLLATVPSVVLLLLVAGAPLWLLTRLVPSQRRAKSLAWWRTRQPRAATLHLAGIIAAVLMIQFVMRQCLLFSNLLLAPALPEPQWVQAILLDTSEALPSVYFIALLAATALTAAFLFAGRSRVEQTGCSRGLEALLCGLLAVQALLVPVNYAILIAYKSFPRVASVGTEELGPGQRAWLIWENGEARTFFLLKDAPPGERALLTVPSKDAGNLRITGYDPVLSQVFGRQQPSPK